MRGFVLPLIRLSCDFRFPVGPSKPQNCSSSCDSSIDRSARFRSMRSHNVMLNRGAFRSVQPASDRAILSRNGAKEWGVIRLGRQSRETAPGCRVVQTMLARPDPSHERAELEARWFALTRTIMPELAARRGWPVRFDHCFQRILLDNACTGPWRDTITPPAYKNATTAILTAAVALGDACIDGSADLAELNARSLGWRGKRTRGST